MRLLFICSVGMHRSRTAAEAFSGQFETKFAGVYDNIVTAEQIGWADRVLVMEERHKKDLLARFPGLGLEKKIACLDVPNSYFYNQPELVAMLKERLGEIRL